MLNSYVHLGVIGWAQGDPMGTLPGHPQLECHTRRGRAGGSTDSGGELLAHSPRFVQPWPMFMPDATPRRRADEVSTSLALKNRRQEAASAGGREDSGMQRHPPCLGAAPRTFPRLPHVGLPSLHCLVGT